jgi:hypothetical protein
VKRFTCPEPEAEPHRQRERPLPPSVWPVCAMAFGNCDELGALRAPWPASRRRAPSARPLCKAVAWTGYDLGTWGSGNGRTGTIGTRWVKDMGDTLAAQGFNWAPHGTAGYVFIAGMALVAVALLFTMRRK